MARTTSAAYSEADRRFTTLAGSRFPSRRAASPDRSTTLRIRGRGVIPSDRFSLDATHVTGGGATLHVEAGSQSVRALGWTRFGLAVVGSFFVDTRGIPFGQTGDANATPSVVAFVATMALQSVAIFGAL